MSDLVERIVNAIVRQEGRPPDDVNPGDLRDPVWFPGHPPTISDGVVTSHRTYYDGSKVGYRLQIGTGEPFWVPSSREAGIAGLTHIVSLHLAEGDSLSELIQGSGHYAGFAPSRDGNQTAEYIAHIVEWAGLPDATQPMWNFLTDAT